MTGRMPSHAIYTSQLLDFSKKNTEEVRAIVTYLDDMLSKKTNVGLVTTFEEKIWNNKDKWITDSEQNNSEQFDPVSVVVEFLEKEFKPMIELSLEKFLMMQFSKGDIASAINRMCNQLKVNADVLFPSIPALSMRSLPSNNWIIVPANGGTLTANVTAYANSILNTKVALSTDRNNIYWYNLIEGIPLFALPEIHSYEKAYKKALASNLYPGMHLYESEEENWKDFPLLDNQALWATGYSDLQERQYVQRVQNDTDSFLESGLIQKYKDTSADQNFYKAYVLDDVTLEQGENDILNWCKNYIDSPVYDSKGLIDIGAEFIREMEQFCDNNGYRMQEVYVQNNSIQFSITDKTSLYKAMRLQRFLYKRLCKTFEIYKECRDMIDQHNQTLLKAQKLNADIDRFAKLIKAGIIQIQDEEELAYYEESTGKQSVFVNYFSLNPIEKTYAVFYVFEKFCEIDGKIVAELEKGHNEYIEQAKQDKEMINAYNSRGAQLKAKANAAINQLNKYTEQQNFAMIGKTEMPNMLDDFYKRLNLYC